MKKKILELFLVAAMVLSLCACGNDGGDNKIGETYTSNGVEFTLNYVEFTDCMDVLGGANDNYWKPLENDDRTRHLDGMTPKSEDDIICVISYTAKNISKDDITIDDNGTLDYDNGYTYSDGGLTYRVSPTGVWKDLEGGLRLKKLKEEAYEFRAFLVVPKVVTETDKPLTFKLFGKTFDLRK